MPINDAKERQESTHFGFETVSEAEKTHRVGAVFHSVANSYDVMNDLMSLGIHRFWKQYALHLFALRPGHRVLDVAAGSGDLAASMAGRVGNSGEVLMTDINSSMLQRGRDRLLDKGRIGNVHYALTDVEQLSFPDNIFDRVSIGFGLRNVTRIDNALTSMYRVLKPGGRLMVLEFSKPVNKCLSRAYDAWSFKVLPKLGQWVANDAASYQYLVESIRRHPDQEELKNRMLMAGFDHVRYHNLTGGVVAIHFADKY